MNPSRHLVQSCSWWCCLKNSSIKDCWAMTGGMQPWTDSWGNLTSPTGMQLCLVITAGWPVCSVPCGFDQKINFSIIYTSVQMIVWKHSEHILHHTSLKAPSYHHQCFWVQNQQYGPLLIEHRIFAYRKPEQLDERYNIAGVEFW